jgi:hypothetical protein
MNEAEAMAAISNASDDEAMKIVDEFNEMALDKSDDQCIDSFVRMLKVIGSLSVEKQDKIAKIIAKYYFKAEFPRDLRMFNLYNKAVKSLPKDVGTSYVSSIPIYILEEILKTKKLGYEKFKILSEVVTTPELRALMQAVTYEEEEHANHLRTILSGLKINGDIFKI